jgi:hypothetical protein
VYTYITENDHNKTAARRLDAAELQIGAGGERYIATDTWCYNCGDEGHYGDVKAIQLLELTRKTDRTGRSATINEACPTDQTNHRRLESIILKVDHFLALTSTMEGEADNEHGKT